MSRLSSAFTAFRSGQGLKGQLLRGGVGSVAIKLGSTVLNVVLAIVLARALGVEGFGVYSFVFALITIMAIPAQMGLPNLVVRETAKAQAVGDWALMKGLWRWSSLMALAMSAALMAIGGLAAWVFAANLPEGGLAVFYWGLVLVPLVALGNLRGAALRGLRRVVQGQLPEFILRPAFLVVLVLGLHFGLSARALTASDAMMLHALASLVSFAIGAWMLMWARPAEMAAEQHRTTHPGAWLRSALPLGIVAGVQIVNQNIGLVVLGVSSPPEEVGIYRVALQGASVVSLGLMATNLVVAPHIARLYQQGDMVRLQRLVKYTARVILSFSLPATLLLVVFGQALLLLLFGSEFAAAYIPLIILCAGQTVNSATATVAALLNMTGHEQDVAFAVALGAIINLTASLVLLPWGAPGVALAGALGLASWNLLLWRRARQRLGIESSAI